MILGNSYICFFIICNVLKNLKYVFKNNSENRSSCLAYMIKHPMFQKIHDIKRKGFWVRV